MDKAFDLADVTLITALIERVPRALTKQFVRRPARGWLDDTPFKAAPTHPGPSSQDAR